MTKFRYTRGQLGFLNFWYLFMNVRQLTQAFNNEYGTAKTREAIAGTLMNHNIRCGRKPKNRIVECRFRIYTEEQAAFLEKNYKGRTVPELTDLFNTRFGTRKTWRQIRSFVHNRGIVSGCNTRFRKGHKPWNAETRGQGLTGPNSGSFKKGQVPPNTKPLGHERVDNKDGYVWIKVAEPNPYTGASTRPGSLIFLLT